MNKRVLAYVNRMRKERLGLRPLNRMPKGYSCDPGSCPVAAALPGFSVCHDEAERWIESRCEFERIRFPKYVETWIANFDSGKYPELVR